MRKNAVMSAMALGLLLFTASTAFGGPYSDALGKCIAKSITAEEKTTLLRWSFFMYAAHPAVRDAASITPEQRSAISRKTAAIFERLLTQSCAAESLAATKNEGGSGLAMSFGFFYQYAANEFLTSKEVADGLTETIHYIDREKLKKVVVPQKK